MRIGVTALLQRTGPETVNGSKRLRLRRPESTRRHVRRGCRCRRRRRRTRGRLGHADSYSRGERYRGHERWRLFDYPVGDVGLTTRTACTGAVLRAARRSRASLAEPFSPSRNAR